MLLHYTPELSNPLMWHKDVKVFSIEASSLFNADACPMSTYGYRHIDIYVPASGNKKRFFEFGTERDNEGEVMCWVYRTTDEFELRVYND